MTKRMLIDTTHAEETRVVVLDGNRLDDYDVETSSKKQLKGNIYLAKIVRIEPSLQAAFVEYGGNRHGFLAFSEIHPDYYQIPIADRERLIALQEEEARAEEARADREDDGDDEAPEQETRQENRKQQAPRQQGGNGGRGRQNQARHGAGTTPDQAEDRQFDDGPADDASEQHSGEYPDEHPGDHADDRPGEHAGDHPGERPGASSDDEARSEARSEDGRPPVIEMPLEIEAESVEDTAPEAMPDADDASDDDLDQDGPEEPAPETVGGESPDDGQAQRRTARFLRQYKIQEVMRRRQILLIQVVKEERGNKGAALTTYISLAGRFCVLMPNSLRGGGVSRKITSAADRRRLKEITNELEIPRGMGMIVRTAGAQRPRPEIKRDCEYLLRTWDEIRETTMASIAPCLVYEEASLIKRAIRDVYTRDVEEIVVDGEAGWKGAREFMRTLMPANASKVNLWRDSSQTLFSHYQVEQHLDAMLQPTVQLKSGGYLVINQTEALVAIDVNSGRSTRERSVEETAFRTNIEAADEVARQLRLRDLAGLIVIDFIDMDVRRNNAAVERRLKDALRNDRARIQVGSISHFGLMEMSRQRLRPSIAESSFVTCPHCNGSGFMRGTESSALHVLRAIEEEAGKRKAAEILVHVASAVALYVLNHKRAWLREIETRHQLTVHLAADDALLPPNLRIDRVRPYVAPAPSQTAQAAVLAPVQGLSPAQARVTQIPIETGAPALFEPEPASEEADEDDARLGAAAGGANGTAGAQPDSDEAARKRKRRRRRRGGRREDGAQGQGEDGARSQDDEGAQAHGDDDAQIQGDDGEEDGAEPSVVVEAGGPAAAGTEAPAQRGRRRRGGRNRHRGEARDEAGSPAGSGSDQDADRGEPRRPAPAAYVGPTPADPFAGSFDIFEMIDREADQSQALMPNPAASAASLPPMVEPTAESADLTDVAAPARPIAETPAETLVETGTPVEPDPVAADAVASAKPRKPRASRARKPAVAAVESPDAATGPVSVDPEPAAAARPARKPSARSRAKAAPVAEPVGMPVADDAQDGPTTPGSVAASLAVAEPVAQPVVEPVTEPVTEPGPAEPETQAAPAIDPSIVQPKVIGDSAASGPRRTGWWKR
jgi:ribonuclease E